MDKALHEWSLRTAMRRLWADHVVWTRQYVVAAVAGTPDAEQAAVRLLRNQEDIGHAITGRRVTRHDLEAAVEDVVAGRPVRQPETQPFGCAIVW